jgi:hypothetical protein
MRGRFHILMVGAALALVAPATQATAATTSVRYVITGEGSGPSGAPGTTHAVMRLRRATAAVASNHYQLLRNAG